jgi:4-diphosphocytidyl-2-C-methyl-D-erythritol kinase
MIEVPAPAKVNLVLEVLNKRNDGYHEVRSLMQAINFCDLLRIETAYELSFECNISNLQTPDNLVMKAAELLRTTFGCKRGAKIQLEKKIPSGTGLGGGSSDAAIALLALNRLWNLHVKLPDLLRLGAQLGSDVPFFLHRGMALVKGRGEQVIPLPSVPIPWFVVLLPALPEMPGKTKNLYARLKERHFTHGQYTSDVMQSWSIDYRIDPGKLFNVFDEVAFDVFPELEDYWLKFKEAGADNIHLAGSGPSIFAPFDDQIQAGDVNRQLADRGLTSYVVSAIAP